MILGSCQADVVLVMVPPDGNCTLSGQTVPPDGSKGRATKREVKSRDRPESMCRSSISWT